MTDEEAVPSRVQRFPALLPVAAFVLVVSIGIALLSIGTQRSRAVERSAVSDQTWSALARVERSVHAMVDTAHDIVATRPPLSDRPMLDGFLGEVSTFDGAALLRGHDVVASAPTPVDFLSGHQEFDSKVPEEGPHPCEASSGTGSRVTEETAGRGVLSSPVDGSNRFVVVCATESRYNMEEPSGPVRRALVWASLRTLRRASSLDELAELDSGLDYELLLLESIRSDARRTLLLRSRETPLLDPVERVVPVAGKALALRLEPREGWQFERRPVTAFVIVFALGLGASVMLHDLLRRPAVLRRELDRTARRLLEAERELTREFRTRRVAEDALERDRVEDRLTGLATRETLISRLEKLLDRMRAGVSKDGALVLFGVGRMSAVTEGLGHAMSDELLKTLPRRLGPAVGADVSLDRVLARLGGDDFCVLLEHVDGPNDAIEVAGKLRESFDAPFRLLDREVFLSCRIGIAPIKSNYRRAEQVLRDANVALQRAKALASAESVVFDEEMHRHALELLELESDLRRALDQGELFSVYQPIVSLATGCISGFESLTRWSHPTRGMVPPVTFVPIAEETGSVTELDRLSVRTGASQLEVWQRLFPEKPPLKLSVNLSGKTLLAPGLVAFVEGVLTSTGVPASSLHLEVTETVVMENAGRAAEILEDLRSLGVRLYLDDFGTGYSSLSYLQRFPFHTVKIDRAFVMRMTESEKDAAIVKAIIHIAHSLGMELVAEGVETEAHVERLRELGCEYGQGYFFSKPLPRDEIDRLLCDSPRWRPRSSSEELELGSRSV